MNLIQKEQIQRVEKGDIQSQVKFSANIFAILHKRTLQQERLYVLKKFLQQNHKKDLFADEAKDRRNKKYEKSTVRR